MDGKELPTIDQVREQYGDGVASLYESGIKMGMTLASQAITQGAMVACDGIEKGAMVARHAFSLGAFKEAQGDRFAPVDPERELTDED